MVIMTSHCIIPFLTLWSFTVATPVHNAQLAKLLEPRQAPNCNIGTTTNTSNFAAYDSACWNQLDIMTYLTNWTANTPKCLATEDDHACCGTSETWSTCFLRLATGKGGAYDCTEISLANSQSCPVASQGALGLELNPYLSPNIASQANYVVFNIITINYFFTAYYTAFLDVLSNESSTLSSILNPVPLSTESSNKTLSTNLVLEDVTLSLQNVIAALTLGLAFGGLPAVHLTVPDDTSLKSWTAAYFQDGRHHRRQVLPRLVNNQSYTNSTGVSQSLDLGGPTSPVTLFIQSLQQAPDVAAAIWPSMLNSTNTITTANLPNYLIGGANQDLLRSLNAGLDLIMNDVGTFIAFAGYGLFSSAPFPASVFLNLRTGLTAALDTYTISEILMKNSVSATPGLSSSFDLCNPGPLCKASYLSPVTGRQYQYTGDDSTFDFLQEVLDKTQLNLPVLFDGAYNCTMAGTVAGSVVSVNPDSSLNVACLSALPMNLTENSEAPQAAVQLNETGRIVQSNGTQLNGAAPFHRKFDS